MVEVSWCRLTKWFARPQAARALPEIARRPARESSFAKFALSSASFSHSRQKIFRGSSFLLTSALRCGSRRSFIRNQCADGTIVFSEIFICHALHVFFRDVLIRRRCVK